MRILHIITTIERGGAENQLKILVEKQIKHDEVFVLFIKGSPELKQDLESLGVKVIGPVFRGLLSVIFVLKIWIWVLMNPKIVIHAHLPHAELLATFLKGPVSILVNSRHNSEPFFPKGTRLQSRILSRLATSRSNHVIAISQDVRNFLTKSREVSSQKSIKVVLYGYEAASLQDREKNRAEIRSRHEINPKDLVIGTISRLVEQKDIPTLLEGYSKYRRTFPHSKLMIIGDGELRKELVESSKTLGLGDSVIWIGRTSEVDKYLDAIDIFSLTSRYEGFGLVLLEAMNRRVPIVATRVSAIPEVLGSKYAYLFELGNPESLASRLLELSKLTPLERTHIGKSLRERLAEFEPEVMEKRIMKCYLSNE